MTDNRLTNQPDGSTREVANTSEQPVSMTESWMQQLSNQLESHGILAQASAFNQVFVRRG